MDPEAMRCCMSFGFSDKKSKSAIGKCKYAGILSAMISVCALYLFVSCGLPDGNGFKTSSMRLGADVIVFSRHRNNG